MSQTQFPPVVYAPTVELADDGSARLALHPTDDGRVALFVYSALDRLTEFYRADSPWVLLTVEDLQRAYETSPYDLLFLDKRPQPGPGSEAASPGTSEVAS